MNENSSSGYPSNEFVLSKNSSNRFVESFHLSLLREIKRLKQQIDYNGFYTAFLLGQYTEEEFEKIARKFIDKERERRW